MVFSREVLVVAITTLGGRMTPSISNATVLNVEKEISYLAAKINNFICEYLHSYICHPIALVFD